MTCYQCNPTDAAQYDWHAQMLVSDVNQRTAGALLAETD